jgi:DNA-binding NtrC family response regulator
MKKDTPWIIIHDATKGDMAYACECLRCGAIQKVVTPISIDYMVALAKAFAKQHRGCKERKGGTL